MYNNFPQSKDNLNIIKFIQKIALSLRWGLYCFVEFRAERGRETERAHCLHGVGSTGAHAAVESALLPHLTSPHLAFLSGRTTWTIARWTDGRTDGVGRGGLRSAVGRSGVRRPGRSMELHNNDPPRVSPTKLPL